MIKKSIELFLNDNTINEASLGRFYQHFQKGNPIGIISASRDENTSEENNKLNKKLRYYLKLAKFGYIKVKGHSIEIKDNKKINVVDDSTIIFGTPDREKELRKFIVDFGIYYKQDSVLFINAELSSQVQHLMQKDFDWRFPV